MNLDSLTFGLLSGSDTELAASLRDYLSDKASVAKTLLEDIAISIADETQVTTLKTKWQGTKIPMVNDGSFFTGTDAIVSNLVQVNDLDCQATGSAGSTYIVITIVGTKRLGLTYQEKSLNYDNIRFYECSDGFRKELSINQDGYPVLEVRVRASGLNPTVKADFHWIELGEQSKYVIDPDGATADTNVSLYLSTDLLFDKISQIHDDVDNELIDDTSDAGAFIVDKSNNKYFCTIDKITDILNSSNQTVDVVVAALDTLASTNIEIDNGTLVTNFRTILQSKFQILTEAGSVYFTNVKDVFVDNAMSVRDKIAGVLSLISTGTGDIDDNPNNRLSETTGVSPFTALISIGQVVATVAKSALNLAIAVVTNILGATVVGACDAVWKGIKAMTGSMDAYVPVDKISRAHFNKYTFRGKIATSYISNNLMTKLNGHPGRIMAITTPFALITLRLNGVYVEFDLHWIPIHPGAFDDVFGGIRTSKYIYNGTPSIPVPTTDTEALDQLNKLFALGQQATSYTIGNDYLIYKAVWLSQLCFCHWLGLLNIVNSGVWPSYITVMLGLVHGNFGFNDYPSASDVDNLILASLLCGMSVSDPGYYDVSGNAYTLAAIEVLFNAISDIMIDDESFYPFSYKVAVPVGRYNVYSDSALAAIGIAMVTAITVAVVAVSSVFVAKRIQKKVYQMRTMAQAASWECLDKQTGQVAAGKAKMLNKCRKREKLAALLDNISSKMTKGAADTATQQLNSTGVLYNAQRAITNMCGASVYSDEETTTTLPDIYHSIRG